MKFFNDCESFSFFISSYVVFLLQIFYVYYIDDEINGGINYTLTFHKRIFALIYLMKFCSHCFASFSDAGVINKKNNKLLLEFYNHKYKEIFKIKQKFERHNLVLKENENALYEVNEIMESENNSNNSSSLNESRIEIINKSNTTIKKEKSYTKKYDFEVNKCKTCHVFKPKNTEHCFDCNFCILEGNNHCPWMNNCMGLFNKKFYILFCIYAFIACVYSASLYFYYVIVKNFGTFRISISKSLKGIFFLFLNFIYGGFCYTLLRDERKEVIKEFRDYRNEKKNLMKLKMRVIFGGKFSLKWFFPCFKGGKVNYNSFNPKNKKEIKHKIKKKLKNILFKKK